MVPDEYLILFRRGVFRKDKNDRTTKIRMDNAGDVLSISRYHAGTALFNYIGYLCGKQKIIEL